MTFSSPLLRLTSHQHEVIVGHCYDGYPDEACGLLTGRLVGTEFDGRVTEAVPCTNAARSAMTYTVDGRDFLRATRAAEARGEEIVGVWHSHTHTDPYPSPTDVRLASDPMWMYVIVSLRDGVPMLRAYRIRNNAIAEVAVQIDS